MLGRRCFREIRDNPRLNYEVIGFLDDDPKKKGMGIHGLVPGITGWAQINGRDDLPIPIKVGYDEYYLNHRSFLFDLKTRLP